MLVPAPPVLTRGSTTPPLLSDVNARIADDGRHILVELDNGQRLHLLLPANKGADQPPAAVIPLNVEGFDRLEAIARLLASLHGRAIPPDTRLTTQQLARARRMLRAADGAANGATQQEIAEAIFHTGPLTRDEWQVSSTRYAVMSLLGAARAMLAGGYRRLLCHRRKP